MTPDEFVKEYGLDNAKKLVNSVTFVVTIQGVVCDPCFIMDGYTVPYAGLKRIVESHEIVTRYENDHGESARWFFVGDYCKKHQLSPLIHSNYNEAVLAYNKLVEDVESCQ